MLLRLAYLGLTNTFALLRLLCTARKVVAARQAAYRYSLMSPLRTWVRSSLRVLASWARLGWWCGFGWSLLSGLVGSVLVVVPLVFGKDLPGVCLVEDKNVVADLVA